MAGFILKLSDIKLALKKEKLNFKVQTSKLNGTEDSITFIHGCNKTKIRGKIVRSFNEGEVRHWPSLNHENVARLIDILPIHDNLCIYLTVHNEVTLKNIVHDVNFMYDSKCFDRKRSYAKGIFSGLSYLHGKSLTLMNLCDDNIIISKTDDRAIIANFDHLTNQHKVTKSRLNIPEMYMAPETEKAEFDAKAAEIWASGILMLDMFLSHMVPWAIVNFEPKNVIKIVGKISPELFQAANAGSVVSAMDLTIFQTFLKCFLKQNPLERLPTSYACTASFLQNGDEYKTNSYESYPFPENMFPLKNCNQDLQEERCLNPTNDPPSNSIPPREQGKEIANVTSDGSAIKAQQMKMSFQIGKNNLLVDQNFNENHWYRFPQTQEKKGATEGDMEMIKEGYLYFKMSEVVNFDKKKEKVDLEYCIQDLPEGGYLNSIGDPSSNSTSLRAQKREIENATSDISVVKTRQTKKSFETGENKTENIELIRYFDFGERPNGSHYDNLPVKVNQTLNENHWNKFPQHQETEGAIKGDMERTKDGKFYLKMSETVNFDKSEKKIELGCCKKVEKKLKKKGKKERRDLKKLEEQNKPSFFFTCLGMGMGMGGSVEEPVSNVDILCEAGK